jgi:hypothetical protein
MFGRKKNVGAVAAPPVAPKPPVHYVEAVTILPEEGAKMRINSAADIDPTLKKTGSVFTGGAGGYGGAAT